VETYIGRVAGVGGLEGARDLDGRARGGAATPGDVDLSAAHIELGRAARVVDGQALDPQEVLAIRNALGDVCGVCGYIWSATAAPCDKTEHCTSTYCAMAMRPVLR